MKCVLESLYSEKRTLKVQSTKSKAGEGNHLSHKACSGRDYLFFLIADKNESESPVSAGILSVSQNEYGTIFTVPIYEGYNTFLPNYY